MEEALLLVNDLRVGELIISPLRPLLKRFVCERCFLSRSSPGRQGVSFFFPTGNLHLDVLIGYQVLHPP